MFSPSAEEPSVRVWVSPLQLHVLTALEAQPKKPCRFCCLLFCEHFSLGCKLTNSQSISFCSQGLQQDSLYLFATCSFFFFFKWNLYIVLEVQHVQYTHLSASPAFRPSIITAAINVAIYFMKRCRKYHSAHG